MAGETGMAALSDVEGLEIELLHEAVFRRCGVDFRGYDPDLQRERIRRCRQSEGCETISGLIPRILHRAGAQERLIDELLAPESMLFRQPGSFLALRQRILPVLRTYPYVRVWHAGCGSGQEVYSLAIVLHEEGLLDRSRIYATDLSARALAQAAAGSYPVAEVASARRDYLEGGGKADLGDYVAVSGDNAAFHAFLREHVVFAQHNLVTDQSFNEFNLIMCRDVLTEFGWPLQERVHRLLADSLARLGILAIGAADSAERSPIVANLETVDAGARLYRRLR